MKENQEVKNIENPQFMKCSKFKVFGGAGSDISWEDVHRELFRVYNGDNTVPVMQERVKSIKIQARLEKEVMKIARNQSEKFTEEHNINDFWKEFKGCSSIYAPFAEPRQLAQYRKALEQELPKFSPLERYALSDAQKKVLMKVKIV